jgi:hypothetical protein
MSFLSCPRALQFYRIESLHPPRYPVPATVHRDTIQEISCSISRVELCLSFLNGDGLLTCMCQSYACVYPRRPTKPCSGFQHMGSFSICRYSNVWQSTAIFTCQRSRISSSTDWNTRLPKSWERLCRIRNGQILTLGCTFCSDFQYFLGISWESSLHCFQCEESPWEKICKWYAEIFLSLSHFSTAVWRSFLHVSVQRRN